MRKRQIMWTILSNLVDPLAKFIKNFGFARTIGYTIILA